MKRRNAAKILSLITAFSIVIAFCPLNPAFAITPAGAVADAIKAINSNFSTAVSGDTVTVTGTVGNVSSPLTIDIPSGVTVEWKAALSGVGGINTVTNTNGLLSLLNLTGEGNFFLSSGGSIVSNGTTSPPVSTIEALGPALTLNGLVSSQNGPAVFATVTKDITVSGGLVTSASMNAICVSRDGATVKVTGGSVFAGLPMFSAIGFSGNSGGMNVIITGGSVQNAISAQPKNDGSTPVPVYRVPVHVTNPDGVCDVTAYYTVSGEGFTYEAQTDLTGDAYIWLPAGAATIIAEKGDKLGQAAVTVSSSANPRTEITMTTSEEDVAAKITAYNANNGGGTGALTASVSGSTVTVAGSLANVTKPLSLTVPEDVKIIWKAKLAGAGSADPHNPSALLKMYNEGVFEIADGAEIINSGSYSAAVTSSEGSLILSGGKVISTATPSYAIGIASGSFLMTGGEASGTLGGISCTSATVAITGGTLSATGSATGTYRLSLDTSIVAVRGNFPADQIRYWDSGTSGVIRVDSALSSASIGSSAGLSVTPDKLPIGGSLTAQWAIKNSEPGINVLLTVPGGKDKSWFMSFPGVNVKQAGGNTPGTSSPNTGSPAASSSQSSAPASSTSGSGSAPVPVTQPGTVKANVFAEAKEKKIDVTYTVLDSGSKVKYEWIFKGNKMNKTDLNVDLTLNITTKLPAGIKSEFAAVSPLVLEFGYHGDLPGETDVRVYVGDRYKDGSVLSLYYYNDRTGKTEFVADGLVVKGGYVTITINHCSTYLLAANKMSTNPKTGDENNTLVLLFSGMISLSVLAVLQFARVRKNRKTK